MDLRRAVTVRARVAKDKVVDPLRQGSRTVHIAPETGIGFGNYLYLLFDADRRQAAGQDYRVLAQPAKREWLAAIAARRLTVDPGS